MCAHTLILGLDIVYKRPVHDQVWTEADIEEASMPRQELRCYNMGGIVHIIHSPQIDSLQKTLVGRAFEE